MVRVLIMMTLLMTSAFAGAIKVQVKGMVCDFCASTMEAQFKNNPNVQSVDIDLKGKTITLELKPGKNLSDKTITSMVTNQGYVVSKIDR